MERCSSGACGASWAKPRAAVSVARCGRLRGSLDDLIRSQQQRRRDREVERLEPHTEIIRKGKLAKPTEFGRRVKIQEAEAQFITDYEVCEPGPPERALWEPALDRHLALFDHAPYLAVADGCLAAQRTRGLRPRGPGRRAAAPGA
jgi:hypothetical protein